MKFAGFIGSAKLFYTNIKDEDIVQTYMKIYDIKLYDGDMITCKGLFSQEANQEADKILRSKSHILNVYGENMRQTTNEGIQTIYMMTRFKNK